MQRLSGKEKEIMNTIWAIGKPCLISEILNANTTLSRNTVAKSLVTLEQAGYLKVDSIRKTVTRTGRCYLPTLTPDIYDKQIALLDSIENESDIAKTALAYINTLLEAQLIDDTTLAEIETLIKKHK